MKNVGILAAAIVVLFLCTIAHAIDWSRQSEFLIDTHVVNLNNQYDPSIAFDGTNYLVVWLDDRSDWYYDIWGARVDQDGNVLDPVAIAISSLPIYNVDLRGPSVAFDGTNYLVTWGGVRWPGPPSCIWGARLDTLGTVLNTVDILIHTPPTPGICLSTNPSVAFDGTNYLVVWKEETYHPRWVKGVRVDTSGNVLDTAIAISRGEIPHIAFDGTNYLVVWDGMYYGSSRIRRARLDTFGNVLDTAITISNGRRPHIAFDGTNYLIVWSDYRSGSESDIYGARLNTSGIVIDSFPVSLQPGDQDMPNLAHGTDGQILITYSGWTDSISGNPVNRMRIWGKLYPFVGIKEGDASIVKQHNLTATIFHGPLILPEGKQCKVFDITGRAVEPDRMQPGIYFIEIGGVVTQKVVKLR